MKTPEFVEKHSRSWSDGSSDYDDNDPFSAQYAFCSSLPRDGSDIRESAGGPSSFSEALIAVIDQRMKEQTAQLLHAVEAVSVRLAQLEKRTLSMEGSIDDLKASLGNYHGIAYGKLKEMENLLREVQSCTVDIRDKQDITLAQIHLTELQISKGRSETPLNRPETTAQETLSSVLQQHDVSPHQNALVATVTLTPSIPHQELYYQPPSQSFHGPSFLQQPPQMPQTQQHFIPSVPPTTSRSFSIPPNDFLYPLPQNVSPSVGNPPFQHFDSSCPTFQYQSMNERYSISPHFHPQSPCPQKESRYDDLYHHGLSNRNSAVETFQLPVARLLPHALPTASLVDSDSSSRENRNSNNTATQSDDVVEKVVAMGFQRDAVRSTVRRMTEKGQRVDPNMILDMLTNGEEAPQTRR